MYQMCLLKNVNFILKSSSKIAWSYIHSQFFLDSVLNCPIFKLVTDVTRTNEEGTEEDQWCAGPNFIKLFNMKTTNNEIFKKINKIVFCRDHDKAY